MSTTQMSEERGQSEANKLYWHSDRTVDEIVSDLGMTRGALYSAIHPVSAGMNCPTCGSRMVFRNRSNRSASRAACSACGTEAVVGERASEQVPFARVRDRAGRNEPQPRPQHAGPGAWSRWRDDLSTVEPQRAALVGGAAVLGVVVGAAAARAVREML